MITYVVIDRFTFTKRFMRSSRFLRNRVLRNLVLAVIHIVLVLKQQLSFRNIEKCGALLLAGLHDIRQTRGREVEVANKRNLLTIFHRILASRHPDWLNFSSLFYCSFFNLIVSDMESGCKIFLILKYFDNHDHYRLILQVIVVDDNYAVEDQRNKNSIKTSWAAGLTQYWYQ